jgi:hypothetical protein
MRITEPAIAAMRQHHALASCRQVGKKRFAIFFVNLRADRDLEYGVSSVGAMAVLAHAAAAVLGKEMLLIAVIDQGIEAGHGFGNNIATFAAIAAVRPAKFNELFPPKRYAAVSTVAGADIDLSLIEEFHAANPAPARTPTSIEPNELRIQLAEHPLTTVDIVRMFDHGTWAYGSWICSTWISARPRGQ